MTPANCTHSGPVFCYNADWTPISQDAKRVYAKRCGYCGCVIPLAAANDDSEAVRLDVELAASLAEIECLYEPGRERDQAVFRELEFASEQQLTGELTLPESEPPYEND